MQPGGGRGNTGAPSGETPLSISHWDCAPRSLSEWVSVFHGPRTPNPYPGRRRDAAGCTTGRSGCGGASTPSLREPGRRSGTGKRGVDSWKPGWVCGAPQTRSEQQRANPGNKWQARPPRQGPQGDLRARSAGVGSAGLGPPRPGASRGSATRAATRGPGALPAPHTHCCTPRLRTL